MHSMTRHEACAWRDCRNRPAAGTLFPFQQTETLLHVQERTDFRMACFAHAWVSRRRRGARTDGGTGDAAPCG